MRIRTGYSFRTAIGHLPDVADRVKEIGWDFAPITDRASTFGFNRWTAAATERGMRPIYGVELGVVLQLGVGKPVVDYWTFLAIDSLRPIHDLIARATRNPGREPSLVYEDAVNAQGVIRIAGERVQLDHVHQDSGFFLALDPSTPRGLFLEAKKRGHKFVASSANFYPRESDKELYRVTLGSFRSGTQTYPMSILSDTEWQEAVEFTADPESIDAALKVRDEIADACRATMKTGTLLVPEKPKTLRLMCQEGAVGRKVDLTDPVYSERLDRELRLIDEKRFEDYFYVVADLISWAKQRMIVGPARGSSCGSLVCYLIGITAIDPIPYDLVFERFIDTTRSDLPDIDIDFSDVHRSKAFEYAEARYGKERVARLGTVTMFQSKSVLSQVGAALKIPKWMVAKVSASVIRRSGGDNRANLKVTDTLKETIAGQEMMHEYPEAEIVGRMENHPSNAGQHAAGLVLTQDPMLDFVAVDSRNNTAMCDLQDAKDLNLLKLDALGLTQLSIFERTLELIGREPTTEWLESLPLDDPAAFAVLNNRHFSGVFQFTGATLQSIAIQVKVDCFEDIVAMTALCRPGPMGSGGTQTWIRRKNNKEPVTVSHPLFEPYTRDSLGIVIYQEQVMRLGREVGGLSWADVNALRRSMSKSLGKEFFDKYGDPWKAEVIRKGVPKKIAEDFWDDMCSFGMMGFNRSHAVAYGLVSYWACYLKAHHPVEFAAATLDAEDDPGIQLKTLRELHREGVAYVPVDPERSTDRWAVVETEGRKSLVGPLTSIKGIGPVYVRKILDCRKTGTPIPEGLMKRLVHAKTPIDSLYPISDAIKQLYPDGLSAASIVTPPTPIEEVQAGVFDHDVVVVGMLMKLQPLDENELSRVAKRGHRVSGLSQSVNFWMRDDSAESGDLFCKLSRFDYPRLSGTLLNETFEKKTLIAVKGNCPKDFRMLWVKNIRVLGEMP